jgi:hypothetical protein
MAQERPEQVRRMYAGATRVAPGIYRMPNGDHIINATEILEHAGLVDTDENRRIIAAVAKEFAAGSDTRVIDLGGA